MSKKTLIVLLSSLFSILITVIIWLSIAYFQLENENLKLQIEKDYTIEVIKAENKNLENEVIELQNILEEKKITIDSLKTLKQKVIVKKQYIKEYIVSDNIAESTNQLKEHLKWER